MSHNRINQILGSDKKESIVAENNDKSIEHLKLRATHFASSIGKKIDESSFTREESEYGDPIYSFQLKPQMEEQKRSEKNEKSPKSTDEEIRSLSSFEFLDRFNKVYRELTGINKVLLLGAIDTQKKREEYNKKLINFEILLILKKYGANPECIMSHEAAQSPFILSIFNTTTTTSTNNKNKETEYSFKNIRQMK